MSNHLTEKVLDRIHKEHLTPRPRWQFLAKEGLFWLLWVVSTVVAALAAAAIAFAWVNAGWEFRELTHGGWFRFLLEAIPFLWLAALGVLIFVAYENVRKTARGYRYPVISIIGFSLLAALFMGVALFTTGIGARVEEGLGRRIPMHRPVLLRQERLWADPARGLLGGEVVSVQEDGTIFQLRTFDGDEWTIALPATPDGRRIPLEPSSTVRLIGIPLSATGTGPFQACAVFPWRIQGGPPDWDPLRARSGRFTRPASPPSPFFLTNPDPSDPCASLGLPVPLPVMRERVGGNL